MTGKFFMPIALAISFLVVSACGDQKAETKGGAAAAKPVNLALGKTAVESGFEKANSYNGMVDSVGNNAIDGNKATRWSSDWKNDKDPNIAWMYVDLGKPTEVSKIDLYWEAAYALNYTIQVSDDAQNWTVVYEMKDNFLAQNYIKLAKPVTTRYVKLNCTKRATSYGYSLWEFEIY